MVLADPIGSVLASYVETGKIGTAGSWVVEGIGEDFIPPIADLSRVSTAYSIADEESFTHRARAAPARRDPRRLVDRHAARRGAALLPRAERAQARRHLRLRHRQQVSVQDVQRLLDGRPGLARIAALRRPARPDVAPLRGRRRGRVAPDDTLLTAFQRMRVADVSQLPVLADDRVVGILDESDLLLHVYRQPERFRDQVATAMTQRLETLRRTPSFAELLGRARITTYVAIIVARRPFLRPDHPLRSADTPAEKPAVNDHDRQVRRRSDAGLRHARDPRRPVARSVDRRDHDADLRDLDLRADQPRRAQGLRLRAHRQPDARSRWSAASPTSKAARAASPSPRAWPAWRPCSSARRRRAHRRQRRPVRRHVSAVRERAQALGRPALQLRRHDRPAERCARRSAPRRR